MRMRGDVERKRTREAKQTRVSKQAGQVGPTFALLIKDIALTSSEHPYVSPRHQHNAVQM